MISQINIETGRLWGPLETTESPNDVELTIRARIQITQANMDNLQWGV